jgi:hypothetical protein
MSSMRPKAGEACMGGWLGLVISTTRGLIAAVCDAFFRTKELDSQGGSVADQTYVYMHIEAKVMWRRA